MDSVNPIFFFTKLSRYISLTTSKIIHTQLFLLICINFFLQ